MYLVQFWCFKYVQSISTPQPLCVYYKVYCVTVIQSNRVPSMSPSRSAMNSGHRSHPGSTSHQTQTLMVEYQLYVISSKITRRVWEVEGQLTQQWALTGAAPAGPN